MVVFPSDLTFFGGRLSDSESDLDDSLLNAMKRGGEYLLGERRYMYILIYYCFYLPLLLGNYETVNVSEVA